jgi:hypothetical protein
MADFSATDQSLIQWFVSVMFGCGTAVGSLFLHVYSKIERASRAAAEGDKSLWDAMNGERKVNSDFREKMIETVAKLPTREDHQTMEGRIMAAIKETRK